MSVRFCPKTFEINVIELSLFKYSKTPALFDKIWRACFGEKTSLSSNNAGFQILRKAAQNHQILLIKHICEKDKSIMECGDTNGWSALLCAAQSRCLDSMEVLLDCGADPNLASVKRIKVLHEVFPYKMTVLWYSAQIVKDVAMCELLLMHGAIASPMLNGKANQVIEQAQSQVAIKKGQFEVRLQEVMPFSYPKDLLSLISRYIYPTWENVSQIVKYARV